MNSIIGSIKPLLIDFSPVIIFYGCNYFFNTKVALLVSIIYSIMFLLFLKVKKIKVSFIITSSVIISVVFGLIDLNSNNLIFSKYESVITNLIFASIFALTLRKDKKPIILELAEKQGKVKKEEVNVDLIYYFKLLTKIWVLYFILKSTIYSIVGYSFNYENTKTIQFLFGNISFYSLLGATIFGGKTIYSFLDKNKFLPSCSLRDSK